MDKKLLIRYIVREIMGIVSMAVALFWSAGTMNWRSFIPGAINIILLIFKTALEDRLLQVELTGYPEYSRRVSYRLIPGLW